VTCFAFIPLFLGCVPLLLKIGVCCARTIVEAHGGRIWAESTHGDGAVFQVELPSRLSLHRACNP
jgi:light-regulated signal transduction histidine kinase (bacteriophytochrome)